MSQLISREGLKTLSASGRKYTIAGVLPKQCYEAGHIPGANNRPPENGGGVK